MIKKIGLMSCVAALIFPYPSHAQFTSQEAACSWSPYSFIYFNGIRTTSPEAQLQLATIESLTRSMGYGTDFKLAYNTSTYVDGSFVKFGWNDILEVFEQRMRAQPSSIANRYELFFEAQRGGGSLSEIINLADPGFLQFMSSTSDEMRGHFVNILASLRSQNYSISDYAAHQAILNEALDNGQKLLLFSHSQGALFANQADIYAQQRTSVDRVRTVYAAPASPQVFGAYTLADNDLVINYGLRALGPVVDWNVRIPGYDMRPAGLILRPGKDDGHDRFGHGLMEIYFNPKLSTYKNVTDNILRAYDDLSITPNSMNVFDISLTWTGGGEIKMRIDEPNHPAGIPGQIGSTTNSVSGPDTYRMPCASTEAISGRYMITYQATSAASGRRAELTIKSAGKILTQLRFALAPDTSPVTIASVRVTNTGTPGVYSVSIF
ncbi:MAG: hypothetical protein IIZ38_15010 [Sphingomonas sp.]|uniref:hypothetical protein n=1 Tax=Sphingomonas sp. TaxID=28214 RepID=UPI0025D1C712|nr:hypothetical protein [Sphingomonas sp.]MBQ1499619.1 hypothetical protein [Sphingomonas sp.]MBQ8106021.1 hypothetical protein [Afipia sp.]